MTDTRGGKWIATGETRVVENLDKRIAPKPSKRPSIRLLTHDLPGGIALVRNLGAMNVEVVAV